MKCPYCGNPDTRVVDSRPVDDNSSIRRRRVCDECGRRFTSYERVEMVPLVVIKKDRTREIFDRSKIEAGVLRACHKRPISAQQEVSSTEIGELVMDRLKDLDPVAYVRFASVYREFKDAATFMDELKKLLE